MSYDLRHEPYKDYKPTPKQKKCKHKKHVWKDGRYPENMLKPTPDFFFNVCSNCGARGYDGIWYVENKYYNDSDIHDFIYGHSREDCKGH